MKTAKDNWTLLDIEIDDIKNHRFFPNWVRAGYNSKEDALEGILKMMEGKEGLFSSMGLAPGQVTKRKKKS